MDFRQLLESAIENSENTTVAVRNATECINENYCFLNKNKPSPPCYLIPAREWQAVMIFSILGLAALMSFEREEFVFKSND